MKKLFLGLVVFFSLLVLVACGGKNVTMSFETDGGNEIAPIVSKAGASYTKPADPQKADFTFGGWYSDVDLLEPYTLPEVMPEEDITIYAKWLVTITFDTQGGPQVDPITGEAGRTYLMPADPTREGYVFVGWYTDKEYTNKLNYVMPKKNTTAYARWQVFEEGSKIELDVSNFFDNDKCFALTAEGNGTKITATSGKGEWSYVSTNLPVASKANTTFVVVLVGKAGTNVTLKLEGGNAESAKEDTVEMTGKEQTVIINCDPSQLSSILGQKFLVFLNGGTTGATEGDPEWVTIKSAALYRTVEATADKKAALYFVTNGADEIPEIYAAPGTAITMPADPERAGYIFGGWYSDKDFTTPFALTTLPENGAVAYAKWDKAKELLADISLMGHKFDELADYEVETTKDSYKFKKLSNGGEWSALIFPFPEGANVAGYDHLRITILGPAGQKLLVKINDSYEVWVDTTGKTQHFDLPFTFNLDTNKGALVLFANAGVAGESGEFVVSDVAFGNHANYVNLLGREWSNSPDVTPVTSTADSLVFKKLPVDGMDWDAIILRIEESLVGYNRLSVEFKGPAGEQILFKIYDQGAGEKWVTCDGTVQKLEFDFELEQEANKPALVLFANPGVKGTGNEFEIYSLAYYLVMPEAEVLEDVNLLGREWTHSDVTTVTSEENKLTLAKQAVDGAEWDAIILRIEESLVGYNNLHVEVKGTAGEQVLFKIFDQGAGEKWVTLDGTLQKFDFAFELEQGDKPALVIFANPGVKGTAHEVEITSLLFSQGAPKEDEEPAKEEYDLLGKEWTHSTASSADSTADKLTFKKEVMDGVEWDALILRVEENLSNYKNLHVEVKGPEGEQVLFKIFDQGAGEKWVTCDGTVQKFDFEFDLEQGDKPALVIFANPGTKGTGNEFVITSLKYTLAPQVDVKKDIDLTNAKISSAAASYSAEYKITISKQTGDGWENLGVNLVNPNYTGVKKLCVEVKGTAGEQILFKPWDAKDCWVTCDGTVQKLEFDISDLEPNANKAAVVVFANAGAAATKHPFEITKLYFADSDGKPLIDLMMANWPATKEGDAQLVKVEKGFKKNGGGEWDFIGLNPEADLTGYNELAYSLRGTPGVQVILKINDQKETWVTIGEDGTAQGTFKFELDYDANKIPFLLFVEPGKAGTGALVIVDALVLSAK